MNGVIYGHDIAADLINRKTVQQLRLRSMFSDPFFEGHPNPFRTAISSADLEFVDRMNFPKRETLWIAGRSLSVFAGTVA